MLDLPVSDADEAQFREALQAAMTGESAVRIAIFTGPDADGAPSAKSLEKMQFRMLCGTRRIFRAASGLNAQIWLVTRGAQRVTSADTVSPVQSCLWGFGRAASPATTRVVGWAGRFGAGRHR